MGSKALKNKSGFTLVELLIVVAIVGVLATIGIPSFRRMVQKSRKAEAKMALGSLYKVEQTFFTEFGAYGNNLPGMGYVIEGGKFYAVGFPGTGMCLGTPPIEPSQPADVDLLCRVTPSYFPAGFALCPAASGPPALITVVGAPRTGAAVCLDSSIDPTSTPPSFKATATAAIAPGSSNDALCDVADANSQDCWSIDQNRVLVNEVDGIH